MSRLIPIRALLQQNIWFKAMGPDYMVQVSQLVHSIDPNVRQYINEMALKLLATPGRAVGAHSAS